MNIEAFTNQYMKQQKHYILLFALLAIFALFIVSCNAKKTDSDSKERNNKHQDTKDITIKYAKGFRVENISGAYVVEIEDPQKEEGKSEVYKFVFVVDRDKYDNTEQLKTHKEIDIPIEKVVCMTTLQLSNFITMNELDKVVGITSTRHIFNEEVKARIKNKKIHKIGIEGNFDSEVIMAINPDVILISPFKRGGYDAIKDVGIPLIPHLGYKESTPLAQAEWIKFVGMLTGNEEKANETFSDIEQEYNKLREITSKVDKRPTVFSGDLKGGNWYAVGGKSFLAQLFRDAGADYFLKDDDNTGGVTLDFETVYSKAAKCNYWRLLNSYDGKFSYDALKEMDGRYTDFDAFKNKGLIYCNLKERAYYEYMPTRPDLLLKDFIKVFHPELLPDYEPTFYELMN